MRRMAGFSVVVDERRCEGAKDCIKACEPQVFAMRAPNPALPFLVRLKVRVHGGKQAYVKDEPSCVGCMKCVAACPERAITVTPLPR